MADKITKRDAVFLAKTPDLFDGRGWHKKGQPTEVFNVETLRPALFEHAMIPAVCAGVETGEFYAVATDDNKPIGTAVGKVYYTPSNLELFRVFEEALAGSGYEITSCGTVDNRAEFFCDARAKEISAGGREIAPFVGINRIFGGLSSVIVSGHDTVMQCANTTSLFRKEALSNAELIKARNTINIAGKMDEIKKAISTRHGLFIEFAKAFEAGAAFDVSLDTAREAYVGFMADGKLTTRTANRVNRLSELFRNGKGNSGKNALDWFNGLTEFFTHESVGSLDNCENDDEKNAMRVKQWHSSEFGKSGEIKSRATSLLFGSGDFQKDNFNGLVLMGRETIKKASADALAII